MKNKNDWGKGADLSAMLMQTIGTWAHGKILTGDGYSEHEIIAALEICKLSMWQVSVNSLSPEEAKKIGKKYLRDHGMEP